jgi:hypothetical protein
MSTYFLVKPGPRAYIAVGGASMQICHYFDHGFLEEEKSSMVWVGLIIKITVDMNDIFMKLYVT